MSALQDPLRRVFLHGRKHGEESGFLVYDLVELEQLVRQREHPVAAVDQAVVYRIFKQKAPGLDEIAYLVLVLKVEPADLEHVIA